MNILKTRSITVLLSFITISLCAQTKKNSNEVRLVKEINISSYIGKKYQVKADIRSGSTDSSSQWGLFVLQVGKGDYDFITESGQNNLSSEGAEWKNFSIEGVILPGAKKIWLYLTALGNGDFIFDNLELKIQENNSWKTIQINNHDFEETATIKKVLKGFKNTRAVINNPNIRASIETSGNNKALLLSSRNNSVTYQTRYGQNHAAGNYVIVRDGKKIYYEMYGEGEPLILLHGNGGSIHSFKGQIPELAKKYKVIAVDTRGHGNSADKETTSFNYELFADDMEILIRQLNLQHVNIIGWSDGAITGILLSIRNPDLVNKLVLMGANLNPSAEAVSEKFIRRVQRDIQKLKKINDPENNSTIRLMEMLLNEPNIPASALGKIKATTLVIAGEKDLVLEKHTRSIAGNIKGAQLNIVKGETHFLPEENPLLFNKIVLDFLGNN